MPHPLRSFNVPSGAQYGARRLSGRPHAGTDYHPKSNKDGDPIYGTLEGGRVSAKGYGPSPVNGFGHWVKITYPGGLESTNAHMREPSPLPIGAAVGSSTVIGHVGHTGNAVIADPPGSHVHHELRRNGALIDPFAYYGGNATAATAVATAPASPITSILGKGQNMLILEDGGPAGTMASGVFFALADTGVARRYDTRIPAEANLLGGNTANARGILTVVNRGPIDRMFTRDLDKVLGLYASLRQ